MGNSVTCVKMSRFLLADLEDMVRCPWCMHPFDETQRAPKLLSCRHHFCLRCTQTVLAPGLGFDVFCVLCEIHTPVPGGRAEALPTHAGLRALARLLSPAPPCAAHQQPALWCVTCEQRACPACPQHAGHLLKLPGEARVALRNEAAGLRADLQRLAVRHCDLLLRALDATTTLKQRLETQLNASSPHSSLARIYLTDSLQACLDERDELRARLAEEQLQARLDDLVRSAGAPLDYRRISRTVRGHEPWTASPAPANADGADPLVLLGNYCAAQVWKNDPARDDEPETAPEMPPNALAPDSPLFYLDLELDGVFFGRIVIEVRVDVAPRMANNFAMLCRAARGSGYRGCSVFQCWEQQSIITGDFEHNDGRGGRSAYPLEPYFAPDASGLTAVRGAVGMRRARLRDDRGGLVGSQFRIMAETKSGFSAIFGMVVEGMSVVDQLSRTGDAAGKPTSVILISACGQLT